MKSILSSFVVLACAGSALAQTTVVNSNNGGTGDAFTWNTPRSTLATPGAAVNFSNWHYTNVQGNAVVGINTANPRGGNGSVGFNVPAGQKADIELHSPTPLGRFADISALSYDWYRDSSSTPDAHLHISLRTWIDGDGDMSTTNDRGYLIYENVYQHAAPLTPVVTDTWVTADIYNQFGTGQSARLWLSQPGNGGNQEVFSRTIQDWQTSANPNPAFNSFNMASAVVIGFSSGVGSGWNGQFNGAIDNISIGFGGGPVRTFNFEVPTPGAAGLLGLGGLVATRRRRK